MKKISYRGIDHCGLYYDNKIILKKTIKQLDEIKDKSSLVFGHLLHSIVDFVPQPIQNNNNILIANCEIYNWEQLKHKYKLETKNDTQTLLELLNKLDLKHALEEIDGPYAFAYKKDNTITLARDNLGIKPLFYYHKNNQFAFASESKALPSPAIELNPQQILNYDIKTNKIQFIQKQFYSIDNELTHNYEILKTTTQKLLIDAIKKRIPKDQKIGVLFSGGIDSTFIAYILKKMDVDFTCYTAKLEGGNIEEAEDLIYAKEIAKKYNLKLKIANIHVDDLGKEVIDIISLIESRDYIKISVALPLYLAAKEAKKDKVKVLFSGLGSEEIFAGYKRHKTSIDANKECLEGLKILHIRDLYRDDVLSMKNNIEMRLPFLDKELINYSLKIPVKYKINLEKNESKIILRDISKDLGLDERYANRQKKAAQYGSKFDKGLLRLAKNANLGKHEYIHSLKIKD